jgi:hypothetical protein
VVQTRIEADMPEPTQPSNPDLASALEEVRLIRELMQRSQGSSALRRVVRPMLGLGLVFGPAVALFAGTAQWAIDSGRSEILGLDRTVFLWVLGLAVLVLAGALKLSIALPRARPEGLDLAAIILGAYRPMYLRVALPTLSLAGVALGVAWQTGASHAAAGIVTMAVGAVMLGIPLVVPMYEMSASGLVLLAGGAVATFVLPEYPFYKIAVLWGASFTILGVVGLLGARDHG